MSKIKRLDIKHYIGIDEKAIDAGKINIFKGPKGSGKSSIVEALETIFTNSKRRTEVIKHGEEEAVLYVELDNDLEVTRRLRNDRADYLKIRKGTEGVPSTEKYLRAFINGEIFRPIDWVNRDSKEQTKSILNMLKIDWSQEDIEKWFGEIPSNVDFNQHILMVLKAIETKYYKDREEINRQIKELKTQIEVIKKDLPADYDGEVWRDKKVQEYYNKVSEAQKINQYIEQAKALKEGFENKVQAIEAGAESDKTRAQMKYKDQRQDIKDIIDLGNSKIEKAQQFIKDTQVKVRLSNEKLDAEMNTEIQKLKEKYNRLKFDKEQEIISESEEQKDLIHIQENKIAQKNEELNSLDSLEKQELQAIDEKTQSEIEKEEIRVGKAAEYIKNNEPVPVEPLQQKADKVADMQSYLRQWDNMLDIRDNKLSEKERESQLLTARIDKARTLPSELLKTAQMPVDGISVDEKGLIRINGTLIDGLSDGEKLELALKIAKAQAGELKVICLDRWESLDKKAQEILLKEMSKDDFQYFITEVTDTQCNDIEIEKLEATANE